MPPEVVKQLHDAFKGAMDDPENLKTLQQLDQNYWYKSSADYAQWAAEAFKADFDDVEAVLPLRAVGGIGRILDRGCLAEIDVIVLGLGRPVRGEHVFDAGAGGPAPTILGFGQDAATYRRRVNERFDPRRRKSAGGVEQQLVGRKEAGPDAAGA